MASALLFNRARVATATTGTGTVTLGAKVSNKYATFAEAGVANTNVVTYTIEDGNDWEIGRGTYTSSGTTLSRDTVLTSSVGGTVGTSKLNLSGAAEVFITAAKEDFDVNNFTEDTSPDGAADFSWMHDATAVIRKKVLPTNIGRTGGMQLLATGTVSSAATLDIVLTSYTAYKGIVVYLGNFRPATDDTFLWMRLSTDGGSSYNTTGYANAGFGFAATGYPDSGAGFADTANIKLSLGVGNATSEGYSGIITLLNQTSTAYFPKVIHSGALTDQTGGLYFNIGVGQFGTARDTDAIRFLFSSGNIASGGYSIFGVL